MKNINQSGQVIIILLLVVVVALGIGLSIVSRSVNEISNSTNIEDSTRAFSAAQAGIEKLLQAQPSTNVVNTSLDTLTNQSSAQYSADIGGPSANSPMEYPSIDTSSPAQFWLAKPSDTPPSQYYRKPQFNLYFGNPKPNDDPNYYFENSGQHLNDQPAVEVNVILWDGTNYISQRFYFDSYVAAASSGNSTPIVRDPNSKFSSCDLNPANNTLTIDGNQSYFYCKATVSYGGSGYPIMARVRFLYTGLSHPVAIEPQGGGPNGSLPPQQKTYRSTGTSGNSQRRLQLIQEQDVSPNFLDYAIYSASTLTK